MSSPQGPLLNKNIENSWRIGLLATGNELTEGDILNTNGQLIARQLIDHGLRVGMHVMAADAETDIIDSLHFLLSNHAVIIITGGLGPTSDDRTRFALSKVINKPLVFDEACWRNIVERYAKLGISVQPDPSNKQQALFPADAEILPNYHRSAAGCCVTHNNKIIYMLPGPPGECLPMFTAIVLPALIATQQATVTKLKWRLLGVIESEIAVKVEAAIKDYPVVTGYRVNYPYLDVKIYVEDVRWIQEVRTKLDDLFSDYLLSDVDKTASEQLRDALNELDFPVVVEDHATHGQLQTQLVTPLTHAKIKFAPINPAAKQTLNILATGLQEFWSSQQPGGKMTLTLQFTYGDRREQITLTLPFRNAFAMKYAIEYVAREILNFLTKIK